MGTRHPKSGYGRKQYFASVLASSTAQDSRVSLEHDTAQASRVPPTYDSPANQFRYTLCVAFLDGSIVIDEVEFEPDESVLLLHDRINEALCEPHILISPNGTELHLAYGDSGWLSVEELGILHGDQVTAIVSDKPLNRQHLLYRNARTLKDLLEDKEEALLKVAQQQFRRLGGTLHAGLRERTCRKFFDDLCAHHGLEHYLWGSMKFQGFMKAASVELNADEFETFLRLSLLEIVSELEQEAWLSSDVWLNGLF